jgi:hypothetical protein
MEKSSVKHPHRVFTFIEKFFILLRHCHKKNAKFFNGKKFHFIYYLQDKFQILCETLITKMIWEIKRQFNLTDTVMLLVLLIISIVKLVI